jgi:hypothetical protein
MQKPGRGGRALFERKTYELALVALILFVTLVAIVLVTNIVLVALIALILFVTIILFITFIAIVIRHNGLHVKFTM